MAQDRGRWSDYGGRRRGDYETDDLKYRGRSGGYGDERGHEAERRYGGQQRGEAFSRGGWSGERDDDRYGSGQQSGDWHGDTEYERNYGSRGYGQGGYGAQEERYRSDYGHTGGGHRGGFMSGGGYAGGGMGSRWEGGSDRMRGYGQGGSDPNSPTRGGRTYGGYRDERDHERGFMEKAGDEVASWFGDEEAEQRRRQDQHHRGRGPRGYARSDERIREDVNDRLTDDWMLDASDIEVEVNDREVTLSGEVASRADKRRAEDIAEDISGVTHVQNNLRVRRSNEGGGVTGVTV